MNIDDFGSISSNEQNEFIDNEGYLLNPLRRDKENRGDKQKTGSIKQTNWAKVSHNTFSAVGDTEKILPAGFYELTINNTGSILFSKRRLITDELIIPNDPIMSNTLEEINAFWKNREKFERYGFLHRRGYMFYGPPGSGKSALVSLIMKEIIKNGGVIFNGKRPDILEMGLKQFRILEESRPIICLFEDIDAIIRNYGEESLLSLLDGESQIDKVLNIATTNYPEKLDKRLINRPRRFDRVLKIEMPNNEVRKQYLKFKLPDFSEKEIDIWVERTTGYSFAAMSDLIVSVKCFDYSLEKASKRLDDLLFSEKNSNNYEKEFRLEKSQAGFK